MQARCMKKLRKLASAVIFDMLGFQGDNGRPPSRQLSALFSVKAVYE